eukprot:5275695-Amphidinium_carterae.1
MKNQKHKARENRKDCFSKLSSNNKALRTMAFLKILASRTPPPPNPQECLKQYKAATATEKVKKQVKIQEHTAGHCRSDHVWRHSLSVFAAGVREARQLHDLDMHGLDTLLWTKRKSVMIQLGADTKVFVKAWSENDKCSRGDQGHDYLKEVWELYCTTRPGVDTHGGYCAKESQLMPSGRSTPTWPWSLYILHETWSGAWGNVGLSKRRRPVKTNLKQLDTS